MICQMYKADKMKRIIVISTRTWEATVEKRALLQSQTFPEPRSVYMKFETKPYSCVTTAKAKSLLSSYNIVHVLMKNVNHLLLLRLPLPLLFDSLTKQSAAVQEI